MPEFPINFGGLSNSRDRAQTGAETAFIMDAVSLDRSVLEAEVGYSVQASDGSAGQGLGFGRFEGTEEFIKVDNGTAYVATPSASAWTQIATGVESGDWFFQQFGNTIYAVNDGTAGIVRHIIGDNSSWASASVSAPASGDALYPVEGWYNFTQAPSNWWNIGTLADVASGWSHTHPSGSHSGNEPTYLELRTNIWVFDLNRSYGGGADSIGFHFTFDTPQDFSESHFWRVKFVGLFNRNGYFLEDTLYMEFEDSNGDVIASTSIQAQENLNDNTHAPTASRNLYFAGLDGRLSDVKKISLYSYFRCQAGTGSNAQMFITLFRGDVAMNDQANVDLDAGVIVDSINYRYTVTEAGSGGTESNLSEQTITSPFVPGRTAGMSANFMRVGLDAVSTSASGDILKLYRQEKTVETWSYIGSALNTGDPFKEDDYDGTLFIDDTNQEWELDSLDKYGAGFSLDINGVNTQAIGKWKGSLAIGAGTNLYLSKVAIPTVFEDINAAPNALDFNQGRSLYVDDTQSEDVNMIVGQDILYVGTPKRIYALIPQAPGFPKDLTSPRPITNSGPIGPRAFASFEEGIVYCDKEAIWFIQYTGQTTTDDVGKTASQELTRDVRTSFAAMSVNASAVVTVQDGELLLFQGTKYMRLSRDRIWTEGTLNHTIIDAVSDYANDLRLLTDDGKLLQWADGTDFGGSAISWSVTLGDLVVPRTRIISVGIIAEGSPTLTILAFDGRYGSKTQTLTLEVDERTVYPFSSYKAYGSKFRITVAGDNTAKLLGLVLELEKLQDGNAR